MESFFFSKDTLFNDLPAHIKQRIINIRNLSIAHKSSQVPLPTTSVAIFDHISIPSSQLYDVFVKMVQAIEKPKSFDATQNLKKECSEFADFVGFYRLETNNTDFIGEFEKTISVMENKYEKLIN